MNCDRSSPAEDPVTVIAGHRAVTVLLRNVVATAHPRRVASSVVAEMVHRRSSTASVIMDAAARDGVTDHRTGTGAAIARVHLKKAQKADLATIRRLRMAWTLP